MQQVFNVADALHLLVLGRDVCPGILETYSTLYRAHQRLKEVLIMYQTDRQCSSKTTATEQAMDGQKYALARAIKNPVTSCMPTECLTTELVLQV